MWRIVWAFKACFNDLTWEWKYWHRNWIQIWEKDAEAASGGRTKTQDGDSWDRGAKEQPHQHAYEESWESFQRHQKLLQWHSLQKSGLYHFAQGENAHVNTYTQLFSSY